MKVSRVFLLCATLAFVVCVGLGSTDVKCESNAINECIGGYIMGFNVNSSGVGDINLHCKLDYQLLDCTEKVLNRCGKTPILLALGRAVLSYVVFDRKLRVCPRRGYWKIYQLLDTGDSITDTTTWKYKITTLLHGSQFSSCARKTNVACLKDFVPKMKTTPDLCTNIPFKYNCLKSKKDCKAKILDDLLNVFPEEANKVLAGLCQPQDSG